MLISQKMKTRQKHQVYYFSENNHTTGPHFNENLKQGLSNVLGRV